MFKIFLLVICIVGLTINAYRWYYFGGEKKAFNTGLYYVLSFWVLFKIIEDML